MQKKILWAVDALSPDRKLQLATLKSILALTKGFEVTIEPVSVLSPDQMRLSVTLMRQDEEGFRLQAERDLQVWVKGMKKPQLTRPTLLVRDIFTEMDEATTVLNYARKSGAELIAVGTHVNRGFKRFFLGSFAETLLIKSDVPTLIVNPSTPVPARIKKIFFPTDFSEASKSAFEAILPTASELKAKIFLYYKPDYFLPYTATTFGIIPEFTEYLGADLEARALEGAEWAKQAKASDVSVHVIIDKKTGWVDESILKVSKRLKVDLVAMASQSGRVNAALLGSTARKVVRESLIPVWVIHPRARSEARSKESSEPVRRPQPKIVRNA
jgi:nucleotide-binding universal stress UspA family protein